MPNTVEWNQDLNIIEIIFSQDITRDDLEQSTANAIKLEKKHGIFRFLVNMSEADLITPLVDVYDLADKRYDELGASHKGRLALIPSTTDKGMKVASFYEYICVNRGWNVKVISSHDEAIEWLLSPHQDS